MKPRPVLLTGAAGFAGRHLLSLLRSEGAAVAAMVRPGERIPRAPGLAVYEADLRDVRRVGRIVARLRPSVVFHLAALTYVPDSLVRPVETVEANVVGGAALLESVRALDPRPRVVMVSSSVVYAAPKGARPLPETAPLGPMNPYAASKAAVDLLTGAYARTYGLPLVRVRPFNHIGPGQSPRFVAARFALEVARIEAGLAPRVLRVGNLAARRDFSDVRDVVRGYLLAARRGRPGETYNLCSGRALSIRELLRRFLALTPARIRVVRDPALFRAVEAPVLVGDPRKARRVLGWRPAIPLDRTLRDVLAEARERVARGRGRAE